MTGSPTKGSSTLPTTKSIRKRARSRCEAWWTTSRENLFPDRACGCGFRVGEPYSAVLVPDTAILSDQDKRYLLVVDDKNIVTRRDITPGKLLDDGMRVVLPGANDDKEHHNQRPDHRAGTAASPHQLPRRSG